MSGLAHLLDYDADFQTRRLCEALAGAPIQDLTQSIRFIGRHRVLANARWLREANGVEIVHAWGIQALTAAVLAGRQTAVYTPSPETKACPPAWLMWMAKRRGVNVLGEVSPHPSPLPEYRERGQERDRPRLTRQDLGLSDEDFVVLAPGESTRGARHEMAMWSVSILHELDPRWRMLIWGRGSRMAGVTELARRLRVPNLLCQAPGVEFEQLAPLADAALVTAGPKAATLPMTMVMAAGVAVVTTRNSPAARWVGERGVVEDSPRAIAQKLMDVRTDAGLRRELGNEAKNRAAQVFSWERFLGEHEAIYRRALARPRRS